MKKLLLLFFLLAFIKIEAQQNRGIEKSGVRRGFYASFSTGLTSPTGDYKTYSDEVTNADGQVLFGATEKITGKSQFNVDAGYQFGAFGLSLSTGTFKHELSGLSFQSDLYNPNFPLLTNGGAIDGMYYGTGPDYTFSFGKFSTTTSARIGLMDFSTSTFTGSYNGTDVDIPIELLRTELARDGKTSLGYTSIGLKLSYDISKQLSLFTKTDYFITLSDGLKVTDNGVLLHDINNDKLITAADFDFAGPGLETFINERFVKPKMVNVGFGLAWNFNAPQKGKAVNADGPKNQKSKIKGDIEGKDNMKIETGVINSGETVDIKGIGDKKTVKLIVPVAINKGIRKGGRTVGAGAEEILKRKKPGRTTYSNIVLERGQVNADEPKNQKSKIITGGLDGKDEMKMETGVINSGETVDIKKNKIDVIKGTANPSNKRGGKVKFFNDQKGRSNPGNERGGGRLTNIFPPLSSHFTSITEIKDFTWEVIGDKIPNPQYIIEIIKIGSNQQPQRTYIGKTNDIKIAANRVSKFRAGKALADVVKRTDNNNQTNEEEQAGEGQYSWKVTETTTGISSNYSFFTIREGGRTVEAGQVPEKTASNGSDDMGDEQNDTKRAADLKKLADELVNAFAIDDVVWLSIENDHEMVAGSGGGAGKANFKELKAEDIDMDSDGHADALKGIEKSDIRSDVKIKKTSRDKSIKPNVEEENQRAKGDLKNVFPPGSKLETSSHFKSFNEIEYFAWKYIGEDIPSANYIIEITKIGNNGQQQQTFIGQSIQNINENTQTGEEVNRADKKVAKFKAGKALADTVKRKGTPDEDENGEYKWTITETTTGISSNPSFFTISNSETDEDCVGYQENSAMLMVKIDEASLRNTNTVINDTEDTLAKKRDERMGVRALRAKDAREGYRAKQDDARMKDARMKNAKMKDARMKDVRMKDARMKDARMKDARMKDARMKDARMKDARMKDARMKDARTQNIAYKPIETSTVENNKKVTQIDINTKYLRVQNNKTVEISKSYLQLIAPILPCKNNSKTINYYWTVKGTGLNIEDSFNGNSVKYNFTSNGTYEINITPTLNGINLNSFHIIVICK